MNVARTLSEQRPKECTTQQPRQLTKEQQSALYTSQAQQCLAEILNVSPDQIKIRKSVSYEYSPYFADRYSDCQLQYQDLHVKGTIPIAGPFKGQLTLHYQPTRYDRVYPGHSPVRKAVSNMQFSNRAQLINRVREEEQIAASYSAQPTYNTVRDVVAHLFAVLVGAACALMLLLMPDESASAVGIIVICALGAAVWLFTYWIFWSLFTAIRPPRITLQQLGEESELQRIYLLEGQIVLDPISREDNSLSAAAIGGSA